MKKGIVLYTILVFTLLGGCLTSAKAATKSTKKPNVSQFFTEKNIKLYQKNQNIINNVAEKNRENKQKQQPGETLQVIEPVVFKIPYTGLIHSSKKSIIYVRQGKKLLFKGSSEGVLVFNTKNWKNFSTSKSIDVYAKRTHQALSHKRVFKFSSYATVLK